MLNTKRQGEGRGESYDSTKCGAHSPQKQVCGNKRDARYRRKQPGIWRGEGENRSSPAIRRIRYKEVKKKSAQTATRVVWDGRVRGKPGDRM